MIVTESKISLEKYTEYRRKVETILSSAYINDLKESGNIELAMMLTSYMVHSYLEGRSPTDCAMKIKNGFPMVK